MYECKPTPRSIHSCSLSTCSDADSLVPQPQTYPGVQPSKGPTGTPTVTAPHPHAAMAVYSIKCPKPKIVVQAEGDNLHHHPGGSATSYDGTVDGTCVDPPQSIDLAISPPSNAGTFEFPKPVLRPSLSALALQPPLEKATPGHSVSLANETYPRTCARRAQQLPSARLLWERTPTDAKSSLHKLSAVRKAAGEEYANAILATSATPRSHIFGQCRDQPHHVCHLPERRDPCIPSQLQIQPRPEAQVIEACRPDKTQVHISSSSSLSPLPSLFVPFPGMPASRNLLSQGSGISPQRKRPHSARAFKSRREEQRANVDFPPDATNSRPRGVRSVGPPGIQHPQMFRDIHGEPHSGFFRSEIVPWMKRPEVHGITKHRHISSSCMQCRSPRSGAEIIGSTMNKRQNSRSVAGRLINPAEIEMSIQRMHADRSPESLTRTRKGEGHHGIDLHEILDSTPDCKSESIEHGRLNRGELQREVSLREGMHPIEGITVSRAENPSCLPCGVESPPSNILASFSNAGCVLTPEVPNRHTPVGADVVAYAEGHKLNGAETPKHAERMDDGADIVQRSGSCNGGSSESVMCTRSRLSVVEAYSRLGVVCPAADTPALQPWDVNAWKAAWKGSGNSSLGQTGLWTLEAISSIVWDRCVELRRFCTNMFIC